MPDRRCSVTYVTLFNGVCPHLLTSTEAQALAEEIAAGNAEKLTRASLAFAAEEDRRCSLAEIYQVLRAWPL